MSSPPKQSSSSISPSKQSTAATVHQKLSSVLNSGGSSSSKPFMRSKSQTTSSIVFPSFRFSPESEEIREVTNHVDVVEENSSSSSSGENSVSSALEGAGLGDPSSPPPTASKSGGDISPLKEYILKHKWANKWEKRSLSLDLDLKGKLFTALEDKRKSFVSQFLNEEEEEITLGEPMTPLTTSCSIPEQLVTGVSTGSSSSATAAEQDYDDEDVSVHSDTVLFRHGSERSSTSSTRRVGNKLNFQEENCPDYFDYDEDDYDVVEDLAVLQKVPVPPQGCINISQLDPNDLKNLVVEEIGVDCCDDISMAGVDDGASRSSILKEFVLPPEALQERFEGMPTLYSPPSVMMGLRKYPMQEVVSSVVNGNTVVVLGASVDSLDSEKSEESVESGMYWSRSNRADYTVRGLIRNILLDIVYHPWVRYWIGLVAALIVLDFGNVIGKFLWFILGVMGTVICSRALWKDEYQNDEGSGESSSSDSSSESLDGKSVLSTTTTTAAPSSLSLRGAINGALLEKQRENNGNVRAATGVVVGQRKQRLNSAVGNGLKWKSQGWLLMLNTADEPYPDYDPFRNHLRDTKPMFARLNGPYLTISTPHPRHRIPKRRLWSDPVINSEHIFIRHQQFDLTAAKIDIIPTGLAKKRAWSKKYPIGITLACEEKLCGELCSVGAGNNGGRESPAAGGGTDGEVHSSGGNDKVSFSKDEKGNEKVKVHGAGAEKPKGEVFKETGHGGKTIYLFARGDREKDDWFRRFVAATKIKLEPEESHTKLHHHDFAHFFKFMLRACPTMMASPCLFSPQVSLSPRATPTNDLLFESVSMHHVSHQQDQSQSQPSSRKSSPDRLESFNFTPAEAAINPDFLNAIIARLFYDFLYSDRWNEKVKKAIDRKLYFIRKPAMVQSLKVKNLDFGDSMPIINHASTPVIDSQGLWVDLDVRFVGNVVITLEAFINLMKMGLNWDDERVKNDLNHGGSHRNVSSPSKSPSKHAMFDSEADDSGESSESDDDVDLEETENSNATSKPSESMHKSASNVNLNSGGRGKLLKYADSFAKSSVMRNKHVQKMVTGIAATPLILTVEIKRVVGSLSINIPPVPNDRIWVGFRSNPVVEINVRPKVGQRVVSLTQVTEWIKKKILLEFQRVMVCPNMMDVTVPLMEFKLPK